MLTSTRFRVPSMDSADATRAVSKALVQVQGVADIGVSADEGLVEVRFDPGKTDEQALHAAIQLTGHEPQG